MGEHFRGLGYRTHLVGKWHQGFFKSAYLPTRRGFDTFLGYLTGHDDYYSRESTNQYSGVDFYEGDSPANLSHYAGQYSTDLYTDRVVELINQKHQQPWFIYFAQQSVHTGNKKGNSSHALQIPERFKNLFPHIKDAKRRTFAAMVATLDESVGRVFKALDRSDQLKNTIVVFSTDNGGATGGFSGQHIDTSRGSNWPLKASAWFKYDSKLNQHFCLRTFSYTDLCYWSWMWPQHKPLYNLYNLRKVPNKNAGKV